MDITRLRDTENSLQFYVGHISEYHYHIVHSIHVHWTMRFLYLYRDILTVLFCSVLSIQSRDLSTEYQTMDTV